MKTLSLYLSCVLVFFFCAASTGNLGIEYYAHLYGLSCDVSEMNRLTYMFLHGNAIHLIINTYVLVSLAFISGVNRFQFFIAFLIAVSIPDIMLTDKPIVGISTLLYALAGIIIVRSDKWRSVVLLNLFVIGLQAMFSMLAVLAHLYCFVLGLIFGFMFTPRLEEKH